MSLVDRGNAVSLVDREQASSDLQLTTRKQLLQHYYSPIIAYRGLQIHIWVQGLVARRVTEGGTPCNEL